MSAIIDRLLDNPSCGMTVTLGEIGIFVRGLIYSAEDIVEEEGVIVVRANNLSNGESIDISNEIVRVNKTITETQELKDGDLVMCMANGSTALVGKTSYYNKLSDSTATIGAFCGIYRTERKIVRWLMQTKEYKHAISKCLQGGNGAIANISPNNILGLKFVIPQNEALVVELLHGLDLKIDVETVILNNIHILKQYILSQMFI